MSVLLINVYPGVDYFWLHDLASEHICFLCLFASYPTIIVDQSDLILQDHPLSRVEVISQSSSTILCTCD